MGQGYLPLYFLSLKQTSIAILFGTVEFSYWPYRLFATVKPSTMMIQLEMQNVKQECVDKETNHLNSQAHY